MSVPGNRGTEDVVLYAALGIAAVAIVTAGIWSVVASRSASDPLAAQRVLAVRTGTFLGARERDGNIAIRVRGPQGVREVVLPSTDLRARRALMLKPGTEVSVPASGKDAWDE